MPITPFLRNQAFEPTDIETLSTVFNAVCSRLDLADRTDPATAMVASKIIELA